MEPPKQAILVCPEPAIIAEGCVTVAFTTPVHPFASVIVTEYVPVTSPVLSSVVIPPPQLKVYGAVPPDGVKFIAPFEPPLQATLVITVVPETTADGCVSVIPLTVPIHPLLSVIVTA